MDAPPPRLNVGLLAALVNDGLISQGEGEAASLYAKRRSLHLEEALLHMGILDEGTLLKFQATHYRTQFVSTHKLSKASISESLLRLVPYKLALKLRVFPVRYESKHGVLSILTVQPDDLDVLKSVQFATRVPKVKALVARPAAIEAAIRRHYQDEPNAFGEIHGSVSPLSDSAPDGERLEVGGMAYLASLKPPTVSAPPSLLATIGAGPLDELPSLPVPELQDVPASLRPSSMPASDSSHSASWHVARAITSGLGLGTVPITTLSSAPASDGLVTLAGMSRAQEALPTPSASVTMHDYLETIAVLVALLENERGELRNHSINVSRLCRRFCERLALPGDEADAVTAAASLHDIGKNSALHLTALNVAQYEQHRQQAIRSYLRPLRILESVRLPNNVASTLTHLYERYDGQGFPDRQQGKDIVRGARVLAIVETYVDLTGHVGNPFRRKLSAQEAWEAIAAFGGKVFDPDLVDVFKSVVLGDNLRAKLLSGGRRALIVDADAEETTVLELRLAEHGYEVIVARNVTEALDEMDTDVDVVVSEVDLVPYDGFALLQRMRELGFHMPFVFLSRHTESEIVQRGFDSGADEFITKPASPEVVALKVDRVLDAWRRRRPAGGINGSLSEMSLADVVQVLYHGRKSGRLTISVAGKRGEILLCDGQIYEATYLDLQGEEAFYAMLRVTEGDFELVPGLCSGERKIALSPESLLLEGMRRVDESGKT